MAIEVLKIDIVADNKAAVDGIRKVQLTIDELKDKIKYYQDLAFAEKDVSKIKTYNAEIQRLQLSLKQTSNVGKVGFDEMGAAVKGGTNEFSKLYSGVRQLAYIIPGIGIAGLFNLAFEGIAKAADAVGLFNTKLTETEKLSKDIADINKESNKKAGEEIVTMQQLRAATTDVNLSMAERIKAANILKEKYPEYLQNISAETIANGGAKSALDQLTNSILSNARAKAAAAKLSELEAQKLDLLTQRTKIYNDATKEIGSVKGTSTDYVFGGGTGQMGGSGGVVLDEAAQKRRIKERAEAAIKIVNDQVKDLQSRQDIITSLTGGTAIERAIIGENTSKTAERISGNAKIILDKVGKHIRGGLLIPTYLDRNVAPPKRLEAGNMQLAAEGAQLDFDAEKKRKATERQFQDIGQAAKIATSSIMGLWTAMDQGKNIGEALGEMFKELTKKIIAAALEAAIFQAILSATGLGAAPVDGKKGGGFLNMFKGLLGFASGGTVSGPASGYPVMLHGTEHIVRPDQMNKIVGGAAQMGQMMNAQTSGGGEFTIRGNDLVLALQRSNYSLNLRRGG